jgi:hypothetical protein
MLLNSFRNDIDLEPRPSFDYIGMGALARAAATSAGHHEGHPQSGRNA